VKIKKIRISNCLDGLSLLSLLSPLKTTMSPVGMTIPPKDGLGYHRPHLGVARICVADPTAVQPQVTRRRSGKWVQPRWSLAVRPKTAKTAIVPHHGGNRGRLVWEEPGGLPQTADEGPMDR
jgi:hypothetical protein